MAKLVLLLLLVLATTCTGIDNGFGVTPPRGWRSWNQFGTGINQKLIEAQYEALAGRSRKVDGVPTSLLDLGYSSAGIDDGWQKCNSGPGGIGYHDAKGFPNVDTDKFPDIKAMTAKARSLGITPGWYGNNCACKETRSTCALNSSDLCFAGDVAATIEFGFGSVKLDSCGIERNITLFAELFNRTGKSVMIENCHNGNPIVPIREGGDKVDCPMNFFRTSGDIRPQWGSILSNLMTTPTYNGGLTGPGCWGYPDMLEVGTFDVPTRGPLNFLTLTEARTHFSAWCIVSSPLVLSHDLTNDTTMDAVWPIITNKEALAVNDAWVGDAGTLVKKSDETIEFPNCEWGFNRFCYHSISMVWKKQLSSDSVAILLMNNNNVSADVNISWSELPPWQEEPSIRCPASGCSVRDVNAKKDMGLYADGFSAKNLAPHDSAFIIVSSSS